MYYPRLFQDIFDDYLNSIEQAGSGLDLQLNPSSPLYVLARANSTVIADLESQLVNLFTSSSPLTATGFDLDNLIYTPSIKRFPPSLSFGSVIVKPTPTSLSIPNNTILTDLDNGLQFATSQSAVTTTFTNTIIPVSSLTTGFSNNLPAGTVLFTPDFPTIDFFVGSSISSNNIFFGDFTGGADEEDDDSLRSRFLNFITTLDRTSSLPFIKNAVQLQPNVSKSFVKNRIPGIIELWVRFSSLDGTTFYSDTEVDELKSSLLPYIPAGITISINEAKIKYVQLAISVVPYSSSSDFTTINSQISFAIEDLVATLDLGQTLFLSSITTAILPFVSKVVITEPTTDIVPDMDQVVVVSSIKLTLPTYQL